jgi:hypothetical protein
MISSASRTTKRVDDETCAAQPRSDRGGSARRKEEVRVDGVRPKPAGRRRRPYRKRAVFRRRAAAPVDDHPLDLRSGAL